MILVEYVETFIYTLEDIKRIVFANVEEAKEYCITKQSENIENGKAFFLLKFKEVK